MMSAWVSVALPPDTKARSTLFVTKTQLQIVYSRHMSSL